MNSFTHRSNKKELLDGDKIPFADIRQNMQELDTINGRLGGHAITLQGVAQLLQNIKREDPVSIVEIGCGGGDNLRVIKNWCKKKGYHATLTGVDINRECILFAKGRKQNTGIEFICSHYAEARLPNNPSIIFSSLFCHHFSDNELVFMLQWMKQNSSVGFFINDLHRHPLAYHSIKLLTRLFSKSRLVKNDAPLSVLRGFTRMEWRALFKKAQIESFSCTWKWAFRWLIIHRKQ
jgi:2-polyprenyl-3-methyl-5-hydroxy-6-metoxy-1,4-benzoquinol methylase